MNKVFIALIIFLSIPASAADLTSLKDIFTANFTSFYEQRKCGVNVGRLIDEANRRGVDLSNSYVMKIVGAGFLETSGFYARGNSKQRVTLGYFHFIFVADGHVFDFDLDEPLVLPLEDYVRLQFTPPYLPYRAFGIDFDPIDQLSFWTVHRFETHTYLSKPSISWTRKLGEVVNLKSVMLRKRVR
jgi:hypothetical protein